MVNPDNKVHGPTWGPPGSCRPQMGPMLAPWTLLIREDIHASAVMTLTTFSRNRPVSAPGKLSHYNDVIMGVIASQITSLTIVFSTVYSDADQRNHQSSASLAFVRGIHRGPVNSSHKWQLRLRKFHLMTSSCMCIWHVGFQFAPVNGWWMNTSGIHKTCTKI